MDKVHKNRRFPLFSERLAEAREGRGLADCWPWQGTVTPVGYGGITINYRPHLAHRLAYERLVGPIPEGMTIDHQCHTQDATCPGGVCRHRRCINPSHLKIVSRGENVLLGRGVASRNRAKTRCLRGHPYDVVKTSSGKRFRSCRTCNREAAQRRYVRLAAVPKARKTPPYIQIAEYHQTRIRSGALASGAPLPSIREMSQEWDVSPSTITRSMGILRDGGWISTCPGRVPVVAEHPPI